MSAHPNNSTEQKAAWQKRKSTKSRLTQPLPKGAVCFWSWNKTGMFSTRSKTLGAFGNKPVTSPRHIARRLNRGAVHRAETRARDPKHQHKFLNRSQKIGLALRQLVGTNNPKEKA